MITVKEIHSVTFHAILDLVEESIALGMLLPGGDQEKSIYSWEVASTRWLLLIPYYIYIFSFFIGVLSLDWYSHKPLNLHISTSGAFNTSRRDIG